MPLLKVIRRTNGRFARLPKANVRSGLKLVRPQVGECVWFDMKELARFEAKATIIQHLRSRKSVRSELADAAIAKIGADLADSLDATLGEQILAHFQEEQRRLARGGLRPGDKVVVKLQDGEHQATIVEKKDGVSDAYWPVCMRGRVSNAPRSQVTTDTTEIEDLIATCHTFVKQ